MKKQLAHTDASPQNYLQAKHGIYNKYASMLLGYILETVKDETIAEQYLVELFAGLKPAEIDEILKSKNAYCRLHLLVRKKLSGFFEQLEDCDVNDDIVQPYNKFTSLMNKDQQHVFFGVHYHGKTTAKLAAELNKPETVILQLLKQSFTIIRKPL